MPPKEAFVTRVAIIRFDDRNRYGSNGVPSTVLFGGGKKLIVSCKSPHKVNHWAKVNVPAGFFDSETDGSGEATGNQRGELVELWGPVTTPFPALFYLCGYVCNPGLYPNRLTPTSLVRLQVGEYAHELKAYQWHFNVLPCKYPLLHEWGLDPIGSLAAETNAPAGAGGGVAALSAALSAAGLGQYAKVFADELMDVESVAALGQSDAAELGVQTQHLPALFAVVAQARNGTLLQAVPPGGASDAAGAGAAPGREDCRGLAVFSVDNADTRDVDDAMSFEFDRKPTDISASVRLGIHIADVASRVGCGSTLFAWARARASSCYHSGVAADGSEGGSVPMLPPELAHGELSLNQVRCFHVHRHGSVAGWLAGVCA
jgi:hypothetical protein